MTAPAKSFWNETTIARLKALHALGTGSMAVMAAQLSREYGQRITRNAVIGKLTRMGLASSLPKSTKFKTNRETARGGTFRRQQTAQRIQHKSVATDAADRFGAIEIVDLPPDESAAAVPFLELKDHHCRWPIGDPRALDAMLFCGEAHVDGKPYCARHCRIAYTGNGKQAERRPWHNGYGRRFTA